MITIGRAYLRAFGMVHVDQIMHQQMIPSACGCHSQCTTRFNWSPNRPSKALNRLMGCSKCTFMQCFSCFYTGWFLAMGLAVFLPDDDVEEPRQLRRTAGGWSGRSLLQGSRNFRGVDAGDGMLLGPYFVFNPSQGHDYQKDILERELASQTRVVDYRSLSAVRAGTTRWPRPATAKRRRANAAFSAASACLC